MRRSLALAAVLTAAAAVPSHAAYQPYCHVELVSAHEGDQSACTTYNPPMRNTGPGMRRVVTVVLQTGAIDLTLTCDWHEPVTAHLEGLTTWQFSVHDPMYCTLAITAVWESTTAVATSHNVTEYAPQI